MKNKVLVVEDDTVLREVLVSKLREKQYEVSEAEDGEQAMQSMRSNRPDLILLDIIMPRMDGMQVMEAMQKDAELSGIPVIVVSNSGQPVEVERAKQLGAKDFLIKAVFEPNEVIEKVAKVFQEGMDTESKPEEAPGTTTPSHESAESTDGSDRGRVLVVEDDRFLRELFVRKLSSEGFDTRSAIDANGVFSELKEDPKPEIILLDLILPGVNGFEILAKLKKDPLLAPIPVIVISNLGQEEDVQKAMSLGAVDFLIKANYTLDEIITRVLVVLRGDS